MKGRTMRIERKNRNHKMRMTKRGTKQSTRIANQMESLQMGQRKQRTMERNSWMRRNDRPTSTKLYNKLCGWWNETEFGHSLRISDFCNWLRSTALTSIQFTKVCWSWDTALTVSRRTSLLTFSECLSNRWANWLCRAIRKPLSTKTDAKANPTILLRKCRETSTTLPEWGKN
jgi:hypothetical protein